MSRTSEFTGHPQAGALRGGGAGGMQATPADAARSQQDVLRGLDGKQACPFCGAVSEKSPNPCARCGMDNTPEARKATKARIGPWYVLQARNPAAPGMRFDTLLTFVRKGRVRARSVVRGPTTHQLWRFAAHVKGLSREFGLCFSCGSSIETTANICPQCNRLQEPPINPDVLLDGVGAEDAPRAGAAVTAVAPPVFRESSKDSAAPAAAPAPVPPAARVAPLTPPAPVAPPASIAPPAPAAAMTPALAPEPEFDKADIVVPALGGFGLDDDLDAKPADLEPAAPTPQALTAPVAQPKVAPRAAPATAPAAPPRTAPEGNPFSIAPARRKPNGDPGFLSAKDLAAAFQLSFDPSAELDSVEAPDQLPASARPEGMVLPPVTMPRNPSGPHPAPRRGGAFGKFLLFVLVLSASGFAVLMWADPVLRQKTIEWCKTTLARPRSGEAAVPAGPAATPDDEFDVPMPEMPTTSTTAAEASSANPGGNGEVDVQDDLAPSVEPETKVEPPADVKPGLGDRVAPADSDRAERVTPTPIGSSGPGRQRPRPRDNAAPPPVNEPAAGSGSTEVEPAAEPAPTLETMRALKSAAMDAEFEGDYATAVRLYEQIKKLPEELHPSDLGVRLRVAKSQLK